ncbi:iron-containing redox enzyme family protein [Massilia sp. TWR1-2-2]|uniref:iron-containing redox enzyme family protein n=1 Tax=Massilia sp. TWR1-2-2 TaxID=2804584 RepID=UPI003CEDD01E
MNTDTYAEVGQRVDPIKPISADLPAQSCARPRLRENLWEITPGAPEATVETMDARFAVPTAQALAFADIRSHCTGHNGAHQIAERSGTALADVVSMLAALSDAGLMLPDANQATQCQQPTLAHVHDRVERACAAWSRALNRAFVANELIEGKLAKTVLTGWLIEMYHYVRDFPEAIASAASGADGELADLLDRYVEQERGHENFVLQTLVNIGLTGEEVRSSQPLVSTRLIGLLMRELFALAPESVLLVAALVEAHDMAPAQMNEFQQALERAYQLPSGAMQPYFRHQAIDAALGHSELLADNLHLFKVTDAALLDQIVNKLHDLKHAFDLQSHEIRRYYGELGGKYFPRQPMTFAFL